MKQGRAIISGLAIGMLLAGTAAVAQTAPAPVQLPAPVPRKALGGASQQGAAGGPRYSAAQAKISYPNGAEGFFDIIYASHMGYRPLKLDLYRVPGGGPKPILIFVHGGGFQVGSNRAVEQPWGDMDQLMARMAALGYVVIAPSYRLSSEAKWPSQIQDVKTAIRWARGNAEKYGMDPTRVGVWGTSVGGSVAALLGTSCGVAELEGAQAGYADQSSCVLAAVDYFGVTDMAQLDAQKPEGGLGHNNPESSQSAVLGCVLGQCPAEVVQRANPLAYIDASDRKTRFLLVHGDADLAVSWKQSQILHDALKAQGISSELMIIPGAGHYLAHAKPEDVQRAFDRTVKVLGEVLKP